MSSVSSALSIATSALAAQQKAIETVTQNVAQANTPGYSRQEAVLVSSGPEGAVEVALIRRLRDTFLDKQISDQNQSLGNWEVAQDTLEQIELILPEPSSSGLGQLLSEFWNAWQEVSNQPSSLAARSALAERASSLANALNYTYNRLAQLRQQLDEKVALDVGQINTAATQIADLNKRIVNLELGGQPANTLRDQRDLLIDQISKLVKISYVDTGETGVTINIGGQALVSGFSTTPLATQPDPANENLLSVVWSDSGAAADITGGTLKGLFNARDETVPAKLDQLQQLAAALITQVNTKHQAGFGLDDTTGLDFFSGSGADNIAVASEIAENPGKIAAASAAASPGDASNALAVSGLRNQPVMEGGTASIDDFYRSLVIETGVETRQARDMVDNEDAMLQSMTERRQSVSGVSLDEEMANLIKYQHAYQAAAKLIGVVDEMLDALINTI